MSTPLSGKSVLVTGASAGIGRATSIALVLAGAKILATGRRKAELDTLKKQCGERAGSIETIAAFARLVRSGAVGGPIDVHWKVDTGMARLGSTLREVPLVAARLSDFPEVRVRGLMTHLACADGELTASRDGRPRPAP